MMVSVVIPAYNALTPLLLTLSALDRQQGVDGRFEVIVADDGSTDGTVSALRERRFRFPLRILDLPHRGKCHARNAGIRDARYPLILSLDADMILSPHCIAGHLRHHRHSRKPLMLSGGWVPTRIYTLPLLQPHPEQQQDIDLLLAQSPLFRQRFTTAHNPETPLCPLIAPEETANPEILEAMAIRPAARGHPLYAMWEEVLRRHGPELRGFRFPWMTFITGHVSFPKSEALAAGLFDERLVEWGFADWELGYRMAKRGAVFRVDPELVGYHQEHPVNGEERAKTALENYRYCIEKHPVLDWFLLHKSYPGQWGVAMLQEVLEQWESLPDGDLLKTTFVTFARHFAERVASGAFERCEDIRYEIYDRLEEIVPDGSIRIRDGYAALRRAGYETFCRAYVELAGFPLGGGTL
ncbi:MAG: glycosyltransferase [Alicyclobacillaceae bacterium]|nr:glycosyltransferase [Alicyclobacillaceae bacterium]